MDVKYQPPLEEKYSTCIMKTNFIACLQQKAVRDEVPKMTCNVENLLWYNVECPESFKQFKNPNYLRQTFLEEKGEGGSNPNFVKL